MSAFPLSERGLLYVWKVVRVVIQRRCRRWCMLAAWQTVENGPWAAVSRAIVCLCLTRRLLVHRGTASTHLAKEQRRHYQPYLIPTLLPLTDTQGQTVAGPGPLSFAGATLKRTLKRTGRSIKHIGDTLAVSKHQHNSMQRRLPGRWEKTECSASGDKEKEGSGIMGHWQLKSLCKLPGETQHPFTVCDKHCVLTAPIRFIERITLATILSFTQGYWD